MVDKRARFAVLLADGVSASAACRQLGIDRKTGHWWKNGGVIRRNGVVVRVVTPTINRVPAPAPSPRYLSESERVVIADRHRAGRSATSIAAELQRAVSTVARELRRNSGQGGDYRPHQAHASMLARRPRPKRRRFEVDVELRAVVQALLDQHWSPEQVAHEALRRLGRSVAVETIYQALYGPERVLERDARTTLRTKRPYRRPRRRGDQHRPRFATAIRLVTERSPDAAGRAVAGHWEGDLIVGSFNRSAIGTLVERTTRYTMLVHLDPAARADSLCDRLIALFAALPGPLRRSPTWDQGSEMCHHHRIADATAMPVFFCHAGHPWERPSNENTNGLLRDYFPKGTNLAVHTPDDLARVADELNRRPRKTLDWQTPDSLLTTLLTTSA